MGSLQLLERRSPTSQRRKKGAEKEGAWGDSSLGESDFVHEHLSGESKSPGEKGQIRFENVNTGRNRMYGKGKVESQEKG